MSEQYNQSTGYVDVPMFFLWKSLSLTDFKGLHHITGYIYISENNFKAQLYVWPPYNREQHEITGLDCSKHKTDVIFVKTGYLKIYFFSHVIILILYLTTFYIASSTQDKR